MIGTLIVFLSIIFLFYIAGATGISLQALNSGRNHFKHLPANLRKPSHLMRPGVDVLKDYTNTITRYIHNRKVVIGRRWTNECGGGGNTLIVLELIRPIKDEKIWDARGNGFYWKLWSHHSPDRDELLKLLMASRHLPQAISGCLSELPSWEVRIVLDGPHRALIITLPRYIQRQGDLLTLVRTMVNVLDAYEKVGQGIQHATDITTEPDWLTFDPLVLPPKEDEPVYPVIFDALARSTGMTQFAPEQMQGIYRGYEVLISVRQAFHGSFLKGELQHYTHVQFGLKKPLSASVNMSVQLDLGSDTTTVEAIYEGLPGCDETLMAIVRENRTFEDGLRTLFHHTLFPVILRTPASAQLVISLPGLPDNAESFGLFLDHAVTLIYLLEQAEIESVVL